MTRLLTMFVGAIRDAFRIIILPLAALVGGANWAVRSQTVRRLAAIYAMIVFFVPLIFLATGATLWIRGMMHGDVREIFWAGITVIGGTLVTYAILLIVLIPLSIILAMLELYWTGAKIALQGIGYGFGAVLGLFAGILAALLNFILLPFYWAAAAAARYRAATATTAQTGTGGTTTTTTTARPLRP